VSLFFAALPFLWRLGAPAPLAETKTKYFSIEKKRLTPAIGDSFNFCLLSVMSNKRTDNTEIGRKKSAVSQITKKHVLVGTIGIFLIILTVTDYAEKLVVFGLPVPVFGLPLLAVLYLPAQFIGILPAGEKDSLLDIFFTKGFCFVFWIELLFLFASSKKHLFPKEFLFFLSFVSFLVLCVVFSKSQIAAFLLFILMAHFALYNAIMRFTDKKMTGFILSFFIPVLVIFLFVFFLFGR
jgi:hypothetical protein